MELIFVGGELVYIHHNKGLGGRYIELVDGLKSSSDPCDL